MFEISFGNTSRPFKHCPYKQFKVHANVGQQHGASLFIRKDHLENYLFTKHENDICTTLAAAILLTSTIKQNLKIILAWHDSPAKILLCLFSNFDYVGS